MTIDLDDTGHNGHAIDGEAYQAEPLPWPDGASKGRNWWRAMTGRSNQPRVLAGEAGTGRAMPTWVPGVVATVALTVAGQLCLQMYWKGRIDEKVQRLEATQAQVFELARSNDYLKGRVESVEILEEQVGLT